SDPGGTRSLHWLPAASSPLLLRHRFIRSLDRSRRPRRQRHRMVPDLLHYLLHPALELRVVPRDHRLGLVFNLDIRIDAVTLNYPFALRAGKSGGRNENDSAIDQGPGVVDADHASP